MPPPPPPPSYEEELTRRGVPRILAGYAAAVSRRVGSPVDVQRSTRWYFEMPPDCLFLSVGGSWSDTPDSFPEVGGTPVRRPDRTPVGTVVFNGPGSALPRPFPANVRLVAIAAAPGLEGQEAVDECAALHHANAGRGAWDGLVCSLPEFAEHARAWARLGPDSDLPVCYARWPDGLPGMRVGINMTLKRVEVEREHEHLLYAALLLMCTAEAEAEAGESLEAVVAGVVQSIESPRQADLLTTALVQHAEPRAVERLFAMLRRTERCDTKMG